MDSQSPPKPLARALAALERFVFARRLLVLTVLAAFTLLMGFFALQLRMTAGFEKQMPVGHEYVKTFEQYRSQLFGANRLTIAVRSIGSAATCNEIRPGSPTNAACISQTSCRAYSEKSIRSR